MKIEEQRKKVELASVDDLFSTEESRQDATLERIQVILLPDHPFSVRDDDDIMKETMDSTAVNLRQQQLKHPTGL